MPMTEEEKRQALINKGWDPTQYDADENGNIFERTSPPVESAVQEPILTPSSPTSGLKTFSKAALTSIVPTGGSLGMASLATKIPGPWPVKLGAGLLGALGGGAALDWAQRKVLPEGAYPTEQEVAEHPYLNFAGDLAPSLAAFDVPKSAMSLLRGGKDLWKLATSPAGEIALSDLQKTALKQLGINTAVNVGTQGGINVANQMRGDEPFNYGTLARDMATGALLNEPTKLGTKYLGFHPTYSGVPTTEELIARNMARLNERPPVIEPSYKPIREAGPAPRPTVPVTDTSVVEPLVRVPPIGEMVYPPNKWTPTPTIPPIEGPKVSVPEVKPVVEVPKIETTPSGINPVDAQTEALRAQLQAQADAEIKAKLASIAQPTIVPTETRVTQPIPQKGKSVEIQQRSDTKPPYKYSEKPVTPETISEEIDRLLAKRGIRKGQYNVEIKDKNGNPILGPTTGQPIAGRANYTERRVDLGASAGRDTPYHEAGHIYFEDLANSNDPKDHRLLEKTLKEAGHDMSVYNYRTLNEEARNGNPIAKEKLSKIEEPIMDNLGMMGAERAHNQGKLSQWFKDYKSRFGLGESPATRQVSARLEHETPYGSREALNPSNLKPSIKSNLGDKFSKEQEYIDNVINSKHQEQGERVVGTAIKDGEKIITDKDTPNLLHYGLIENYISSHKNIGEEKLQDAVLNFYEKNNKNIGFITNKGRFVGREEASRIMDVAHHEPSYDSVFLDHNGNQDSKLTNEARKSKNQEQSNKSDYEQYTEINNKLKEMINSGEHGKPEFIDLWNKLEEIRNRNGQFAPKPPQENATNKEQVKGSVQEQRQEGSSSGQGTETKSSDSILNEGKSGNGTQGTKVNEDGQKGGQKGTNDGNVDKLSEKPKHESWVESWVNKRLASEDEQKFTAKDLNNPAVVKAIKEHPSLSPKEKALYLSEGKLSSTGEGGDKLSEAAKIKKGMENQLLNSSFEADKKVNRKGEELNIEAKNIGSREGAILEPLKQKIAEQYPDKSKREILILLHDAFIDKHPFYSHIVEKTVGESVFEDAKQKLAETHQMREEFDNETRDLQDLQKKRDFKTQELEAFTSPDLEKNSERSRLNNEDTSDISKHSPVLNVFTSVTDRIKVGKEKTPTHEYVSDKLKGFFDDRSYLTGKYGNALASIYKDFTPQEAERQYKNRWERDNRLPETNSLTPREQELDTKYDELFGRPKKDAEVEGLEIKKGKPYEVSGVKPGGLLPNLLDSKVKYELNENPNSIESKKYKRQWSEWLQKGGLKKDEASSLIDAWEHSQREYGDLGGADYAALRQLSEHGLPWELIEKNPVKAAITYGRRAASELSFFKYVKSDEKMRAALGIKDQFGDTQPKLEGTDFIGNEKDVQTALKYVYGKAESSNYPRIEALGRLAGNLVMGPGTAIRNIASIPAQLSSFDVGFQNIFKGLANIREVRQRALESNTTRFEPSEIERIGDYENPDKVVQSINKLSDFFRKWQGRNLSDKWEGEIIYAIGEEWAKSNVIAATSGDTKAQQMLKRVTGETFDVSKEHDISKVAKQFTDVIRGSYGPQGLPNWAMSGNIAPFAALNRYSVERWNNVYKDVVIPMKGGNLLPFLKYTLGAVLTSAPIIEQINELISNRKGPDLDTKETLAAYEETHSPELIATKVIGLAQLSGYAGIVGDIAKLGSNVARGKGTQYSNPLSFPLYTLVSDTLGNNISQYINAIHDGEDPVDVTAQLIKAIGTQSIQAGRYINAHLNPEETKRKEELSDVRKYREATGKIEPDASSIKANEFQDINKKKFKRTEDIQEAAKLLPGLIKEALVKAGNDPYKLKSEFNKIKQNSYNSMPAPSEQPIEFWNYLNYLRKTIGEEKASERVSNYFRRHAINQVKGSMVP